MNGSKTIFFFRLNRGFCKQGPINATVLALVVRLTSMESADLPKDIAVPPHNPTLLKCVIFALM